MTLEQVEIRGTVYNYIKSEEVGTATGIIIAVNEKVRDKLLEFTGFIRDMFNPLFKDETIEKIVILSSTIKGMIKKAGVFFINSNGEMKKTLTNENSFVNYLKKQLKEKKIPYETINSLKFLKSESIKNNPNEEYFKILNNYYNPQSVNDTGFYVEGKMIEYGSTVLIKNLKSLVTQYDSLKDGTFNVPHSDQVILKINNNGVLSMGFIGEGTIRTNLGVNVTELEKWYKTDFEGPHEETLEKCKISLLHEYALIINESLNNGESLEEASKMYLKMYEDDLVEYSNPLNVLIPVNLLLVSIQNGDVEILK